MTFSEFEKARYTKLLTSFVDKRRPPAHLRAKVDLAFRVTERSVEIFEVRPAYLGKPGELMESPVAKSTFVQSRNAWKLYWMRQDLKWHSYEPNPYFKSIEEVIEVVDRDEMCCFFG